MFHAPVLEFSTYAEDLDEDSSPDSVRRNAFNSYGGDTPEDSDKSVYSNEMEEKRSNTPNTQGYDLPNREYFSNRELNNTNPSQFCKFSNKNDMNLNAPDCQNEPKTPSKKSGTLHTDDENRESSAMSMSPYKKQMIQHPVKDPNRFADLYSDPSALFMARIQQDKYEQKIDTWQTPGAQKIRWFHQNIMYPIKSVAKYAGLVFLIFAKPEWCINNQYMSDSCDLDHHGIYYGTSLDIYISSETFFWIIYGLMIYWFIYQKVKFVYRVRLYKRTFWAVNSLLLIIATPILHYVKLCYELSVPFIQICYIQFTMVNDKYKSRRNTRRILGIFATIYPVYILYILVVIIHSYLITVLCFDFDKTYFDNKNWYTYDFSSFSRRMNTFIMLTTTGNSPDIFLHENSLRWETVIVYCMASFGDLMVIFNLLLAFNFNAYKNAYTDELQHIQKDVYLSKVIRTLNEQHCYDYNKILDEFVEVDFKHPKAKTVINIMQRRNSSQLPVPEDVPGQTVIKQSKGQISVDKRFFKGHTFSQVSNRKIVALKWFLIALRVFIIISPTLLTTNEFLQPVFLVSYIANLVIFVKLCYLIWQRKMRYFHRYASIQDALAIIGVMIFGMCYFIYEFVKDTDEILGWFEILWSFSCFLHMISVTVHLDQLPVFSTIFSLLRYSTKMLIPYIFTVYILYSLMALIGMSMFGGMINSHTLGLYRLYIGDLDDSYLQINWNDFGNSMIMMWSLTLGNNFQTLMNLSQVGFGEERSWKCLYFLVVFVFTKMVLFNIFVGFFIGVFQQFYGKDQEDIKQGKKLEQNQEEHDTSKFILIKSGSRMSNGSRMSMGYDSERLIQGSRMSMGNDSERLIPKS